ncbi:MAG TPA: hypothetical protein VG815_19280 [Chloroflexota bacterium]|nr:hypothetical protein [Chloroflexota bacterium]
MTAFHQDLFRSLVLYFIALGLWGLYHYFRGEAPSGSYLGALVLGVGLTLAQGFSGLLLVATNHHPKDGLHWLYGVVAVLTLPFVYSAFAHKENSSRASLYYALGCAFVVLIALVRSQGTG